MDQIEKSLSEVQTEIHKTLQQIEHSLIDCTDHRNNWSTVADAKRLLDDLTDILNYRS
jgi:hypothetical protein